MQNKDEIKRQKLIFGLAEQPLPWYRILRARVTLYRRHCNESGATIPFVSYLRQEMLLIGARAEGGLIGKKRTAIYPRRTIKASRTLFRPPKSPFWEHNAKKLKNPPTVGLEPTTTRLKVVRYYQLSYVGVLPAAKFPVWCSTKFLIRENASKNRDFQIFDVSNSLLTSHIIVTLNPIHKQA